MSNDVQISRFNPVDLSQVERVVNDDRSVALRFAGSHHR